MKTITTIPETKRRQRPVGVCLNCREERELVAFGLCERCYKRRQRISERVDLHNPGVRPEHVRLVDGFKSFTTCMEKLRVPSSFVSAILIMLSPFLAPVRHLAGEPQNDLTDEENALIAQLIESLSQPREQG